MAKNLNYRLIFAPASVCDAGQWSTGVKIKGFVQTPDEIAGCIIEAVKSEKPRLRYITNQTYEALMKKKFVDVTGDAAVEATKYNPT